MLGRGRWRDESGWGDEVDGEIRVVGDLKIVKMRALIGNIPRKFR